MAILRNLVQDDMDELNRLRAENAALKKQKALTLKVGNKKGISIFGLQAFPVTLYRNQWERILDNAQEIRDFIELHADELSVKA